MRKFNVCHSVRFRSPNVSENPNAYRTMAYAATGMVDADPRHPACNIVPLPNPALSTQSELI